MSILVEGTRLRMVRGDSGRITVSCTGADGTPRPFEAGETVVFTVKRSYTDLEALVEKEMVLQETGEAVADLLPEDTAALPVRSYAYDVRLRTAAGEVHTVVPRSELVLEEEIGHV